MAKRKTKVIKDFERNIDQLKKYLITDPVYAKEYAKILHDFVYSSAALPNVTPEDHAKMYEMLRSSEHDSLNIN